MIWNKEEKSGYGKNIIFKRQGKGGREGDAGEQKYLKDRRTRARREEMSEVSRPVSYIRRRETEVSPKMSVFSLYVCWN